MAKENQGRLAYADVLRVMATLAVIVIHLTGAWVESLDPSTGNWMVCNLYNSLSRWAVPVFVMLSGMFLLDPDRPMDPKRLLRHMLRLGVALAVWGMVYALREQIRKTGLTPAAVAAAAEDVFRGRTSFHLWFIYMMLGLYLVTPVLRAFLRGAEKRDLHYFFLLYALLNLFLPSFLLFRPSQVIRVHLTMTYLSTGTLQYVGYYVAGYYLMRYPPDGKLRTLLLSLGLLGGVITIAGTACIPPARERLLLYVYYAPNVAAMAVAVFVLVQSAAPKIRGRWWGALSQVTFGIYLVHLEIIRLLGLLGLNSMTLPPLCGVPLLAAAVFLCSLAVVWPLSKLPVIGRCLT